MRIFIYVMMALVLSSAVTACGNKGSLKSPSEIEAAEAKKAKKEARKEKRRAKEAERAKKRAAREAEKQAEAEEVEENE